jgi:hypothetical protein
MPENQTQPNNATLRNPQGSPQPGASELAEDRSFDASRESDTEAAHHEDGAHAVRDPRLTEGEQQAEPGQPAGVMDHQDPSRQDDLDDSLGVQGAEGGQDQTDLGDGYVGTTYEPSTVEVNRARMQGDGVGQKDLDYQRDPTGDKSYEEY